MKLIRILEDIQRDGLMMEEIQQKCKISWDQFINKNIRLYRGIKKPLDRVSKIEPIERNARDWSNIPNVLFDKQNEGKAQKRTKCVIFTSAEYEAKTYGVVYHLFIPDDAKITFKPEEADNTRNYRSGMLNLFGESFSLERFDSIIQQMLTQATPYDNEHSEYRRIITSTRDYPDIMNVLKFIHKYTKKNELDPFIDSSMSRAYINVYNIFRQLSEEEFEQKLLEIFDVTKNEIETVTTEQLYSYIPKNTEFWTESTCYAVEREFMREWKASQYDREDAEKLLKQLGVDDKEDIKI